MKKCAWQHMTVGVNRGSDKVETNYCTLDDILLSVYANAENHDTIHLTKIGEETTKLKPLKDFKEDKIVSVKISGVSDKELQDALKRLGLKNLNATSVIKDK